MPQHNETTEPVMVSMKRSEDDKRKDAGEVAPITSIGPDYPYGLTIHLDRDELEKLGIKELPKVGSKMQIEANAMVTCVRQSAMATPGEDPDEEKCIDLQITDLYVGEPGK